MNTLSWLMYVADVLPSVGVLFAVLGVAAVGATGIMLVIGASMREYEKYDSPQHAAGRALQRAGLLKVLPLAFPLILFAVVIPSKQTILMIAASEMGETVVKSPEAQEIFTDLKTILKQQLEALKK